MALSDFEHRSVYAPAFVGREAELAWLRDRVDWRSSLAGRPIFFSGLAGIGKTALVQQFLASSRSAAVPFWVDLQYQSKQGDELDRFIMEIYSERLGTPFVVVIDNAEAIDNERLSSVVGRIQTLKATRAIIFISRSTLDLQGPQRRRHLLERAEKLHLEALQPVEARELLGTLLRAALEPAQIQQAETLAAGHPLAISLLAGLLKRVGPGELDDLLAGRLYDLSGQFALPRAEIISSVRPQIVSVEDSLISRLKRQPDSIYQLEPRAFEELLVSLLDDMGYEVELTPAAGDGGKDILAYMDTELGRLLCLVEAKRYRADRKIGVDLVRSLYDTLVDHNASSAMLVTTSSFTAGARAFQARHEYQLALREYSHLVEWIQNFGRRRN